MGKITVAEARRMRNISQEQMAKYIGKSLNSYRKKETGETKFYVDEAYSICEVLGMSMDDISFGEAVAKNCNN